MNDCNISGPGTRPNPIPIISKRITNNISEINILNIFPTNEINNLIGSSINDNSHLNGRLIILYALFLSIHVVYTSNLMSFMFY